MDEKQYQALVEKVGADAAAKIKTITDQQYEQFQTLVKGNATQAEVTQYKADLEGSVTKLRDIVEKQGTTMTEILAKVTPNEFAGKSIAQVLKEDANELAEVFKSGNRYKEYMINVNEKGHFVMQPFDRIKAAGPHATVGDVGTSGNVSSITSTANATALLRLAGQGAGSVIPAFRNSPWIFDLVNLVNVGFDNPFAIWIEETAKQGASATVAEGATKPSAQYAYDIKSSQYKKEAMLVSFTQEFSMDFGRLQDEIIKTAKIDLINRINSAILPNIVTAATTYNDSANFAPTGDKITNPNDWHVIAALAAQAEKSTFTSISNAAVVSTNKKYRMGTMTASGDGQWLNRPTILDNITLVSNPDQGNNNVMVGDFKQYNVLLRGGLLVKVGYNGNDFANNMFSTVIEQFYFDYISTIRKTAIVKGPDFATVKTAIGA